MEITREPLGVIGLITPWNFPIAIPAWKLAPAIAFGNTVVMKPAELTPATAAALVAILEEAGYEVRVAADGHQAWRILQEETIDLLVADVEMPGMDGFTLTDTLRHSTLPRIPVVLVTSLSSDKHRARGLEVGADAYIVKGDFERTALLEAIGQLL